MTGSRPSPASGSAGARRWPGRWPSWSLVAGPLDRLLKRASPSLRHALWGLVLVKLLLPPSLVSPLGWRTEEGRERRRRVRGVRRRVGEPAWVVCRSSWRGSRSSWSSPTARAIVAAAPRARGGWWARGPRRARRRPASHAPSSDSGCGALRPSCSRPRRRVRSRWGCAPPRGPAADGRAATPRRPPTSNTCCCTSARTCKRGDLWLAWICGPACALLYAWHPLVGVVRAPGARRARGVLRRDRRRRARRTPPRPTATRCSGWRAARWATAPAGASCVPRRRRRHRRAAARARTSPSAAPLDRVARWRSSSASSWCRSPRRRSCLTPAEREREEADGGACRAAPAPPRFRLASPLRYAVHARPPRRLRR